MNCIFCEIVAKPEEAHIIWEDSKHVAFLGIFPNTSGVTVVIPKQHYPSYAFDLPESVFTELTLAAKTVGKLLDAAFPDVGRTALVFEGMGVNHVHAKLFPLHGTAHGEWKEMPSTINTYYETYPGYVSSNDAARADDAALKQLVEKIKTANQKDKR